ncbi:MAG: hypothetical protein JWO43_378 [Candidatus Adlerbacteria bacterium]|nr:hypothetical protein [Candidatus Adlerbacteria bacterium]
MITGSVDDVGRPYIRVEAPGGHSVILQIDTGVNESLVVNRNALHLLGANNSTVDADSLQLVELADLSQTTVLLGLVQIIWFGKIIVVDTLVTTQVPKRPPQPDQPVGFIGTKLLKDCRLRIDFPKRNVEIDRDQD